MDDTSLLSRTAQVLGITASALFAGMGFAFTLGSIPAILKSPIPPLLQQWWSIFTTGQTHGPPLAIISFHNLSFAGHAKYSSASSNARTAEWKGYAFSAMATVAMTPCALIFMARTNQQLLTASGNEVEWGLLKGADVRLSVRQQGRLNAPRFCMPVLGTAVVLCLALK